MPYLKPHSPEWFEALETINPKQAAITKQVLSLARTLDACSVCGDRNASDYEVVGSTFAENTPATVRLCEECKTLRGETYQETYRQLLP